MRDYNTYTWHDYTLYAFAGPKNTYNAKLKEMLRNITKDNEVASHRAHNPQWASLKDPPKKAVKYIG